MAWSIERFRQNQAQLIQRLKYAAVVANILTAYAVGESY
jgi:hypothetical protein